MKKILNRLMCISMLSLLLIGTAGQRAQAQDVSVSYQTFYDNLAPYGQWVSDPQYGNVWVPNEGGDFRPYGTRGHWAMTDYGNTWVSDDPWGWACYHYGRWTYDPYYGWVWIPGYEWAPAWVSWRFGGGYCGWAPLGPGVSVGAGYNCPDSWWVFMSPQYMYQPNCIHYWRGPSYNRGYIRQAAFVNNVYVDRGTNVHYNFGPRADAIQQVTHQPVQVFHVSQTSRPGAPSLSGNRISLYRPAVNRATVGTARPANVIAAPRNIGKPQAATNTSPAKQAPFRQQVQNNGRRGNTAQPTSHPVTNQPGRQPVNQQAAHNNPQQVRQQQAPRQQPAPQQHQQQRQQPAPQQHQQPMQQPRQQPMQQPRQQPMQQPRQQPMQQHQQPTQQPRQQPMQQPRQQPMQQPRQQPMQQHQQPMQQPRQQPMQQHTQAPQQHEEAPREGGRR